MRSRLRAWCPWPSTCRRHHRGHRNYSMRNFGDSTGWRMMKSFLDMIVSITKAAYTVVRLIPTFPTIKIPAEEKVELVWVEKQKMTLVIFTTEGCKVAFTISPLSDVCWSWAVKGCYQSSTYLSTHPFIHALFCLCLCFGIVGCLW